MSWAPSPEDRKLSRAHLSIAFLRLLEVLGAEERAVIVLNQVFDRTHREIVEILGKTEAACRQLLSRARRQLEEQRPRVNSPVPASIVSRCAEALATGDEAALLHLLAGDAVLYADGGGRGPSALKPICGAGRVARFFFGLMKKYPGRFSGRETQVNGEPAMEIDTDGRRSVMAFGYDGRKITALFVIANPDKLRAAESRSSTHRGQGRGAGHAG